MNGMKFDIHLNVGKVYRTEKPGSVEMFYTGKEIADYCNYYNITHGVCIYDEYCNLKELIDNTNAKIYGVQWIVDKDQELDCGKEGWYGIKLHSHRGYRDSRKYDWKPKKKYEEGDMSYGLNYNDGYVKDILSTLPNESLVYLHTQGWPSINNRARPEHLFMLATEFGNLKFIMGHAGGYGGLLAGFPGNHIPPIEHIKGHGKYKASIRNYTDSVIQYNAAALYSNMLHNLFLDSSCYTPDKAIALSKTNKWCIGSDYPFGANKPRNSKGNSESSHFTQEDFSKPYVWNFDRQYKLFSNAIGEDLVINGFQECYDYINKSIDTLSREQYEKMKQHKESVKKQIQQYERKTKQPTNQT